MGTPESDNDKLAATRDLGGIVVPSYVRSYFPSTATILDVGAGWGKYKKLLSEYTMDACEIWQPYVEQENLKEVYREVFVSDIYNLEFNWYDVIIMGDVLEHIEEERAVNLISALKGKCDELIVVVPYQYPQGEVDHNKYEIHHQDKLTDETVRKLYDLHLFAKDDTKGVYTK
jgi:hypothetical protein